MNERGRRRPRRAMMGRCSARAVSHKQEQVAGHVAVCVMAKGTQSCRGLSACAVIRQPDDRWPRQLMMATGLFWLPGQAAQWQLDRWQQQQADRRGLPTTEPAAIERPAQVSFLKGTGCSEYPYHEQDAVPPPADLCLHPDGPWPRASRRKRAFWPSPRPGRLAARTAMASETRWRRRRGRNTSDVRDMAASNRGLWHAAQPPLGCMRAIRAQCTISDLMRGFVLVGVAGDRRRQVVGGWMGDLRALWAVPPSGLPRPNLPVWKRCSSMEGGDKASADDGLEGEDRRTRTTRPQSGIPVAPMEIPRYREYPDCANRWFGGRGPDRCPSLGCVVLAIAASRTAVP